MLFSYCYHTMHLIYLFCKSIFSSSRGECFLIPAFSHEIRYMCLPMTLISASCYTPLPPTRVVIEKSDSNPESHQPIRAKCQHNLRTLNKCRQLFVLGHPFSFSFLLSWLPRLLLLITYRYLDLPYHRPQEITNVSSISFFERSEFYKGRESDISWELGVPGVPGYMLQCTVCGSRMLRIKGGEWAIERGIE